MSWGSRRWLQHIQGNADDAASAVEEYLHPASFPGDVQEFFSSAEETSIEFGTTWYRNLVDTVYPCHDGVRFYILRRDGHPVAALPVLIDKSAVGKHVKSLANYYSALYAPIIAPGLDIAALVPLIRAIRTRHAPLGSFRFAPMDPQSPGYGLLREAMQASGLATFRFYCFGNWFLPVQGRWSAYLAGRDGKLRNTIKRMGKKFSADGGTMESVDGGPGLEHALKAYERVYAASWKIAEPFTGFVPGLIRACAERGWLRLGVAWLKNEPIAAQIWIVAGGKASIYKLAYHQDYKAYAPGTLLTAMLMQQVMERDHVAEVDYLIGDDPYKQSWMSDRRERWGLIAYDPWTISGLIGLIREMASRIAKRLKSR